MSASVTGVRYDSQHNGAGVVLVWSCLVTIFACSWTVVHHKIPEPSDSAWTIFLRKLSWMLITILAPEVTVGIAFNQWDSCRLHRDAMQTAGNAEWTLSHAFYADMGGYVIPVAMPETETANKYRALTLPEVSNILRKPDVRARCHFPKLSKKDIEAFGKAVGLAKLFTCVQSGWLVVQSIARRFQHLPISELEIATLALVAVSFMIYGLWWDKAYDANQQTVIRPRDDAYLEEFKAQVLDSDAGVELDMWALHTHLLDRGYTGFGAVIFSVPFGAVHCIAWNFYFLTSTERYLWRTCSIIVMVSMLLVGFFCYLYNPLIGSTSVGELRM
jgi:hypothetical protein